MNIFTIICKRLDDAARELRISRYSKLAKRASKQGDSELFTYWFTLMVEEAKGRKETQVKRMERKAGISA